MKLLMISAFAAVALLAAATTMRSPSTDGPVRTAGMASLQELQSAIDVNKLPTEDVDDQSLVYSTGTKH